MQAIYASKMYKSSKHKAKIRAALSDPINAELVKQLKSYLDDEYQSPEYVDPSYEPSEEVENDHDDEHIIPSQHSSSPSGGAGHVPTDDGGPKLSEMLADDEDAVFSPEPSESDSDTPQASSGPVDESTRISKTSIDASMRVDWDIAAQADSIKGLLNSRQDTTGVVRLIVKDCELWIHYNDDTNLNNVMEPVIALLNSAAYGNLQFNRLARTENAIVFSVLQSPKVVEPIKEVKSE